MSGWDSETEAFRAFRLTSFEAQALSDGEHTGGWVESFSRPADRPAGYVSKHKWQQTRGTEMGARGRKSLAELTAITGDGIALTRRPEPPAHLCDEASDVWHSICNGLPADWFSAGSLPLLEALCGMTVSQRYTLRAIQALEHGAAADFDRAEWSRLLRQHGELSGRIATLATRLRLTPQSRYGPRSAATAARGEGPRPWET